MMQGFRSWQGLQRFVSAFSTVRKHFVPSLSTLRPLNPPSPPAGDDGVEILRDSDLTIDHGAAVAFRAS
jgi:hypothetical protein